MKEFYSLKQEAFTETVERKSLFFGTVKPVTTEEQALEFISSIRKKYADATHNVYAYILRENNTARFSDDGEPHGTAGLPVLDVLRKEGLTDSAVVVTRYFGGILLGAGGLVRAYTASASSAIAKAGKVMWIYCERYEITSDYTDFQKISFYLRKENIKVGEITYADDVKTECFVPSDQAPALVKDITAITNGKAKAFLNGGRLVPCDK